MIVIIQPTTDTAVIFEQIMRYQEAQNLGRASDLFIQWLQESSKESYEVPAKSTLTIKELDPHFYIGQQIVIAMIKAWSQHREYFYKWAVPTFEYLTSDLFMKPFLNKAVCHMLQPAIKWGTARQRHGLMQCIISGTCGASAQYAFYNLIRKLRDEGEVSKYFKLWYGANESVIIDWSHQPHAVEQRPMANYVVFTEYLMRMKQNLRSNFESIINLVDAAKEKIDRYCMNNALRDDQNYFSDATFRALMDIIYQEMKRGHQRSNESGRHKMYGLIARRFRGYMYELGIVDKAGSVQKRVRKITEYYHKIKSKETNNIESVDKGERA